MPNARPTQPGYYWARRRGDEEFLPTKVDDVDQRFGWIWLLMFGDEFWYGHDSDIEWGPAIPEYRGEGGG